VKNLLPHGKKHAFSINNYEFFVPLPQKQERRTMKKALMIAMAAGLVLAMSGCGSKKKSDQIITQRVVKKAPQQPVKMQEYNDERDVPWIGKSYHVAINRMPSDSLPMVKDETGQKFVDNIFTLTVSREDGSVFFSRQFTKAFFTNYITDVYRKAGILEGIVFDKADGDWLKFAASVGLPQTDEYIPLVIRLSRMGELTVSQDTQMDTNGDIDEKAAKKNNDEEEDEI
jgi:hypothetical protein